MSYYRKKILIRGYTRKKPRTKFVKPYYRNQRYRGRASARKIPRRIPKKPITPLPTKEDKRKQDISKWIGNNIISEGQWEDFKFGDKTYLTYLNEQVSKQFKLRQKATSEERRNLIWEREKAVKKIRDDYSSKLFEEQQKKLKKKEAKEKANRELLLKRRFDFFKDWEINDEKPISEINTKFYGIMNSNRIVIMYPTDKTKDAPFHDKTIEKKTFLNPDPDKFILSSGGSKWVMNPHQFKEKNDNTHFFDLEKIQHFAKKMDKETLKVYHGVNSPVIVQDKHITFAIAPRVADRELFYEKDIEVSKERHKAISKMTKKQLFEKTGMTQKSMGKSELIFQYLLMKEREKKGVNIK